MYAWDPLTRLQACNGVQKKIKGQDPDLATMGLIPVVPELVLVPVLILVPVLVLVVVHS